MWKHLSIGGAVALPFARGLRWFSCEPTHTRRKPDLDLRYTSPSRGCCSLELWDLWYFVLPLSTIFAPPFIYVNVVSCSFFFLTGSKESSRPRPFRLLIVKKKRVIFVRCHRWALLDSGYGEFITQSLGQIHQHVRCSYPELMWIVVGRCVALPP